MHIQSFGRSAVGQIIKHNMRTRETNATRKYKNENIDKSRTERNYTISTRPYGARQAYDNILSRDDVYVSTRKDLNTMCSLVLTLPKDYDGSPFSFFDNARESLDKMIGGEQWVVAARVHMDETTPHMHYMFVPVVPNESKDNPRSRAYGYDYTVSSKKLITRQFLRELHPRLEREMRKREPTRTINLCTGETRERGNMDIEKLQQKQRRQRLNEREKELKKREKYADRAERLADERLSRASDVLEARGDTLEKMVHEADKKRAVDALERDYLTAFERFLRDNCRIDSSDERNKWREKFIDYKEQAERERSEREHAPDIAPSR